MSATQTATPGKTTTWQVDPAHTHVEFAVRHLMISTVRGRFSDVADVDKYPTMTFTGRRIEHPSRDTNQIPCRRGSHVARCDERNPARCDARRSDFRLVDAQVVAKVE